MSGSGKLRSNDHGRRKSGRDRLVHSRMPQKSNATAITRTIASQSSSDIGRQAISPPAGRILRKGCASRGRWAKKALRLSHRFQPHGWHAKSTLEKVLVNGQKSGRQRHRFPEQARRHRGVSETAVKRKVPDTWSSSSKPQMPLPLGVVVCPSEVACESISHIGKLE